MGTSAASKGPGSGVSFDPPWLDDEGGFERSEPLNPDSESANDIDENETGNANQDEVSDPSVAPPARFFGARTSLSTYAREKSGRSGFQKTAGHYSKSGMGGASKLASRMRHSTATGARLAELLTSTNSQAGSAPTAWVKEIVDNGLNGQELIDAIIQQVAPSGGSRDEESSADSMSRALGEFLDNNQDSDLLKLGAEEIREITERYLANEACNRLVNDIGQVIESTKVSLLDSLKLQNEMRDYLRADLSVQIESLWAITANPTQAQLNEILTSAVQRTFEIYEGEV